MFVVLIHFLFKTAYSLYLTTFYLSRTFLNSFFVFYIAVLATFDIIPCHCSNVNLFLFLISATLFILSSFQKKVNNFLLFFLKNFRNFIFYFPFLTVSYNQSITYTPFMPHSYDFQSLLNKVHLAVLS